jgi:hypothetical protein
MFIHALEEHMPSHPPYNTLNTIFHPLFPTTFTSILISLEWGIVGHSFETWSLAPHCPISDPLVPHIIPPFRYPQLSHPFSIPWFSLVIGLHLLYHASFHIKFNPSLPIHSINSFILYSNQIPFFRSFPTNLFTSYLSLLFLLIKFIHLIQLSSSLILSYLIQILLFIS